MLAVALSWTPACSWWIHCIFLSLPETPLEWQERRWGMKNKTENNNKPMTKTRTNRQQGGKKKSQRIFKRQKISRESLTEQRQENAVLTRKDLDDWVVTKSPLLESQKQRQGLIYWDQVPRGSGFKSQVPAWSRSKQNLCSNSRDDSSTLCLAAGTPAVQTTPLGTLEHSTLEKRPGEGDSTTGNITKAALLVTLPWANRHYALCTQNSPTGQQSLRTEDELTRTSWFLPPWVYAEHVPSLSLCAVQLFSSNALHLSFCVPRSSESHVYPSLAEWNKHPQSKQAPKRMTAKKPQTQAIWRRVELTLGIPSVSQSKC